ncbi:hypothetical protein HDU96_008984 [Phlyctochytrium bullatum]|nr:hypothetical protein HDU96_008984 [Phlyctochytrium bullatum]
MMLFLPLLVGLVASTLTPVHGFTVSPTTTRTLHTTTTTTTTTTRTTSDLATITDTPECPSYYERCRAMYPVPYETIIFCVNYGADICDFFNPDQPAGSRPFALQGRSDSCQVPFRLSKDLPPCCYPYGPSFPPVRMPRYCYESTTTTTTLITTTTTSTSVTDDTTTTAIPSLPIDATTTTTTLPPIPFPDPTTTTTTTTAPTPTLPACLPEDFYAACRHLFPIPNETLILCYDTGRDICDYLNPLPGRVTTAAPIHPPACTPRVPGEHSTGMLAAGSGHDDEDGDDGDGGGADDGNVFEGAEAAGEALEPVNQGADLRLSRLCSKLLDLRSRVALLSSLLK